MPWKKLGPYLSERQWSTVREDYSESGDVWNYFTHDHARFSGGWYWRSRPPENRYKVWF
ncbi:MAG: hypothetical protein PHN49_07045 [Candidatus Omnitrophica bacterium]|nr:hypothetical protein [Candidatus Omnitrophota bacterium]MDD5671376.1 hypothetical protein [Candidatus Omnitrophota bacterium]